MSTPNSEPAYNDADKIADVSMETLSSGDVVRANTPGGVFNFRVVLPSDKPWDTAVLAGHASDIYNAILSIMEQPRTIAIPQYSMFGEVPSRSTPSTELKSRIEDYLYGKTTQISLTSDELLANYVGSQSDLLDYHEATDPSAPKISTTGYLADRGGVSFGAPVESSFWSEPMICGEVQGVNTSGGQYHRIWWAQFGSLLVSYSGGGLSSNITVEVALESYMTGRVGGITPGTNAVWGVDGVGANYVAGSSVTLADPPGSGSMSVSMSITQLGSSLAIKDYEGTVIARGGSEFSGFSITPVVAGYDDEGEIVWGYDVVQSAPSTSPDARLAQVIALFNDPDVRQSIAYTYTWSEPWTYPYDPSAEFIRSESPPPDGRYYSYEPPSWDLSFSAGVSIPGLLDVYGEGTVLFSLFRHSASAPEGSFNEDDVGGWPHPGYTEKGEVAESSVRLPPSDISTDHTLPVEGIHLIRVDVGSDNLTEWSSIEVPYERFLPATWRVSARLGLGVVDYIDIPGTTEDTIEVRPDYESGSLSAGIAGQDSSTLSLDPGGFDNVDVSPIVAGSSPIPPQVRLGRIETQWRTNAACDGVQLTNSQGASRQAYTSEQARSALESLLGVSSLGAHVELRKGWQLPGTSVISRGGSKAWRRAILRTPLTPSPLPSTADKLGNSLLHAAVFG